MFNNLTNKELKRIRIKKLDALELDNLLITLLDRGLNTCCNCSIIEDTHLLTWLNCEGSKYIDPEYDALCERCIFLIDHIQVITVCDK